MHPTLATLMVARDAALGGDWKLRWTLLDELIDHHKTRHTFSRQAEKLGDARFYRAVGWERGRPQWWHSDAWHTSTWQRAGWSGDLVVGPGGDLVPSLRFVASGSFDVGFVKPRHLASSSIDRLYGLASSEPLEHHTARAAELRRRSAELRRLVTNGLELDAAQLRREFGLRPIGIELPAAAKQRRKQKRKKRRRR